MNSSQNFRPPDFVVVGAPKCATTALHTYLSKHPELYLIEKELHFFGKDLDFQKGRISQSEYSAKTEAAPRDKLLGEVAIWYLLSKTAAQEIYSANPLAKIIVCLRHPTNLLYSYHSQLIYNGDEIIQDFESAIQTNPERTLGINLTPNYRIPTQGFDYRGLVSFVEQIQRYMDFFPKEQLFFIFQEEFKSNPESVYRRLLDFLSISVETELNFIPINPNKEVLLKGLRDLTIRPPRWIRSIGRRLIPGNDERKQLKRTIRRWNTKFTERSPINSSLKKRLDLQYQVEIDALEKLLEIEIPFWRH